MNIENPIAVLDLFLKNGTYPVNQKIDILDKEVCTLSHILVMIDSISTQTNFDPRKTTLTPAALVDSITNHPGEVHDFDLMNQWFAVPFSTWYTFKELDEIVSYVHCFDSGGMLHLHFDKYKNTVEVRSDFIVGNTEAEIAASIFHDLCRQRDLISAVMKLGYLLGTKPDEVLKDIPVRKLGRSETFSLDRLSEYSDMWFIIKESRKRETLLCNGFLGVYFVLSPVGQYYTIAHTFINKLTEEGITNFLERITPLIKEEPREVVVEKEPVSNVQLPRVATIMHPDREALLTLIDTLRSSLGELKDEDLTDNRKLETLFGPLLNVTSELTDMMERNQVIKSFTRQRNDRLVGKSNQADQQELLSALQKRIAKRPTEATSNLPTKRTRG